MNEQIIRNLEEFRKIENYNIYPKTLTMKINKL